MDTCSERALMRFTAAFGSAPEGAFFAPGRVNLIGEHIDYNGGSVMPCSLSLGTYAVAGRRDDGLIRLVSADFGAAPVTVSLETLSALPQEPALFTGFGWAAYPLGVAAKLISAGYPVGGFEMAVSGDLPRGSGLSSSASLEVLTCSVLSSLFGFTLKGEDAAKLSLAAERDCAGVNCGIMDQFICAVGRMGSAVLLDTQTLEHRYLPFDLGDNVLLILNTNKPRRLAASKYNERRAECAEALSLINTLLPEPKTCLCALTRAELDPIADRLPDVLLRRARHAVTENERTLLAADALERGDIAALGRLLDASHDSLRDDYEVTGKELDSIVRAARLQPGVLGARMTGAGFSGCAIAIAARDCAEEAARGIAKIYKDETGYDCGIIPAATADAPFGRTE